MCLVFATCAEFIAGIVSVVIQAEFAAPGLQIFSIRTDVRDQPRGDRDLSRYFRAMMAISATG